MAESMLKHAGCGGAIYLDLAPTLRFTSPGLAISPKGISAPVFEVTTKKNPSAAIFYCTRCHKEGGEDFLKEAQGECLVCHEQKSVAELSTSFPLPLVCTECAGIISGKVEPKTAKQRKMASLMNVGDDFDAVKLTKVIKQINL